MWQFVCKAMNIGYQVSVQQISTDLANKRILWSKMIQNKKSRPVHFSELKVSQPPTPCHLYNVAHNFEISKWLTTSDSISYTPHALVNNTCTCLY